MKQVSRRDAMLMGVSAALYLTVSDAAFATRVEAAAEIVAIEGASLRCRVTCTLDHGGSVVAGEAVLVPFNTKG